MITVYITDIGDSAVLMGMSLAGAIYLRLSGCCKEALAPLMAFAGAAILVGILKLFLLGCSGFLAKRYGIHSPSGHVALSVAVLGTYAFLIAHRISGIARIIIIFSGILLAGAIALTRITLHAHNVPEVIIGLFTGIAVLVGVCVFLHRRTISPKFNAYALIAILVVVTLALHGNHFPAEDMIHTVAYYLKHSINFCA